MLILCRLVHVNNEFLVQFCDAIFIIPDGMQIFQQLLVLEKRKVRVVSDLISIMSQVLRSETGNVELVDRILFKGKSIGNTYRKSFESNNILSKIFLCNKKMYIGAIYFIPDDSIDLFTKLMTHKQYKLRSRVCIFLQLLGKFSLKSFRRIWGITLRNILEDLVEDANKSVRDVSMMKKKYNKHKIA